MTHEAQTPTSLATMRIDDREVEVHPGEWLIAEAERHGIHIPRFCWHPRLRSVAQCRMCLVEVEGMRGLQPACYVPVKEGMVVRTNTEMVRRAQKGVLESLLINHPLDCPVCDRGGECPLQDNTMAFGPGESRYSEDKRHFDKPVAVSDLVLLDRERCIHCSRCVRVASDIAGDPLIDFGSRGNTLHIITFPDEPFASYFSGNTVQVCPVGALTALPYRFKARPWDITLTETACQMCAVGCRGVLHETRNQPVRFQGVDTGYVNQGWLCDKGRFGYEYVSSPDRLTHPMLRDGETHTEITWTQAVDVVADVTAEAAGRVAAIGGAHLTNEWAYTLSKFMRIVAGTNDIDCQLDDGLPARFAASIAGQARATFEDLDTASAIVLAAPDLKEELPVLYLRVRAAVVERGRALYVVGGPQRGLDAIATKVICNLDDLDIADLSNDGPNDGPVVIIAGRQSLTQDPNVIVAWVNALVERLEDRARVLLTLRRSNVHGAIDMGLAPDLLPGRVAISDPDARARLGALWSGALPTEPGRDARTILEAAAAGDVDVLFLIGADPVSDIGDPGLARAALSRCPHVIASDLFWNPSLAYAEIVVPAAGWGEVDGTITNVEGRVQRISAAVLPPGQAASDATFFKAVADRLGVDFGCVTWEATLAEIRSVAPAYEHVTPAALRAAVRGRGPQIEAFLAGNLVPKPVEPELKSDLELELDPAALAEPARDGALRLSVGRVLYDQGTLVSKCPSLAKLGPGPIVRMNPLDIARLGLQAANHVTLEGAGPDVRSELVADPCVFEGTVFMPHAQGDPVPLTTNMTVTVEGE